MRWRLFLSILFIGSLIGMSQTNQPSSKSPAEVMRDLRLKMLTTSAAELGLKPTKEFPHVFGIVMDWPIQAGTVSVVSFCTGDASIYTTGTFGILGGIGHETVRDAAKAFVKVGEKYFNDGASTEDYPYPEAGKVRFYFVCYDGVRNVETDLETARIGKNKYSDLYLAGQRVVTELRLITEKQKGQTP